MEINNINNLSSSDIEELIHKPVSFSLNDDFFNERTPVSEDHPNLYEDIAPLVQTPRYAPDTSFKKGSSRRKEEARTERNDKYSMLPEFTGKFKYEFVMDEETPSSFEIKEDVKEEVKEEVKFSFPEESDKNIFGEKRSDEDILFGYDINRLFDIQKEISILINAIQRLQSSQLRISRREEELTKKAQSIIKENERKKAIIDKLVDDVTSLYEVLRMRGELVEKSEDILLGELAIPEETALESDEKFTSENTWAEKPPVERKYSASPMSFAEHNAMLRQEKERKEEEKKAEVFIPEHNVSCPGLNASNIAAINRAISSLKS